LQMSKRCMVALSSQHWEFLIIGAAHGSRAVADSVTCTLDAFRPAVIFVELDRADFSELQRLAATGSPAWPPPAATHYAVQAVPEVASALRWASQCFSSGGQRGGGCSMVGNEVGSRRCTVHPVDRDQITTRRRLTNKLVMQPLQLLRARKYWGVALGGPDGIEVDSSAVAAWRMRLWHDCPALYEVLLAERDEFMAYQIMFWLDVRLASTYIALCKEPPVGLLSIDEVLSRSSFRSTARIDAALRWSLDGDARKISGGSLSTWSEWANSFGRPTAPPPLERVAVVCGPAHVDGIADILAASLGGGEADTCDVDGNEASARRFLARNAGLYPRLVVNSDWPWPQLRAARGSSVASGLATGAKPTSKNPALVPAEADVLSPANTTPGLGPLVRLANFVFCRFFRTPASSTDPVDKRPPPPTVLSGGARFACERLRDLSRRPLPTWPAFLATYVVCPTLVFVFLPMQFDMYWFKLRPQTSS